MAADERVILMGEDIGPLGGVFRVTDALQRDFGSARVLDTPLAEAAIIGVAVGLAQLAGAGSRLFIVTNKRLLPSRRILDALGLARAGGGVADGGGGAGAGGVDAGGAGAGTCR